MTRFTFPFVALVAACAPPSTARQPVSNVAPVAHQSPPVIEGEHTAKHTIGVVCDQGSGGWCEEQVEDRMTIRSARDGAIAVTIALLQTNAHSCTFEGEPAPAPAPHPDVRRWKFDAMTDDGPCALVLDWTSHAIQIGATGCRYYCGVRASLDAVFPL